MVIDKIIDKAFYLLLAVVAYFLLKSEGSSLFSTIQRFFNGGQNVAGSGNEGATQFTDVKTSNLSYKKSEYKLMVNRLLPAFDFGTDEEEVANIFKMLKTSDDVKQLLNDFGLRAYEPNFGYVAGDSFLSSFYPKYNLLSILKNELSTSDGLYLLVKSKFNLAGYSF